MTDNFQQFAIYYDMIYSIDTYKELPGEIDFFLKEAQKANGPVLEVGCGTGRIFLPLMNAGIPISGIDISAEMLQMLKIKAKFFNLKPKIKKIDMTELKEKEKYGLIIIPLNSIHHITNKAKQIKTFENFYKALKPNGKLIFSSQFYSKEILSLSKYTYAETYAREDWGIYIDLYLKYNKQTKILQERFTIKDKAIIKKQVFDLMELYCFDKLEIIDLLSNAGFQNINVYKDFKYSPLQKARNLGLWSAVKPK